MDGARLGFCPLHFNPLYLPKAFTGGEIVRIRIQVPPQRSTRPIGCLLEIHPGHWRVARAYVCVCFSGPAGWALDARTLSSRCKLGRGACLLLSDDEVRPHDCCP